MTAVCGGGTSSSQPGYGQALYMVPSMVGALLNNIPTLWAVPLAGFIGAVTYNLSTFCASDPPAVPTFTAQDVVDLLNPYNPLPYNDAQDKFQQLVGAYAWYQVCKCDTVTTPSPPSPPSAPSGMPSINPPTVAPVYPTGQPCASIDFGTITVSGTGTQYDQTFPVGQVTYVALDLVESGRPFTPIDHTVVQALFLNSSGTVISNIVAGYGGGSSIPHAEVAVPAGTVSIEFRIQSTVSFGTPTTVHYTATEYCGAVGTGPGGGVVPVPCPTDPFVQATLDQILALVTLIQRQAAPFAYIAGTTHSGLSGDGSLSVQGLLGAKVSVLDGGYEEGIEAGDPDAIWNVGWINWGNPDGYSERQWIGTTQFLTLPSLAGQYTQLNYSLKPGVLVDIVELHREP